MTCGKWFEDMLSQEGIRVTDANRDAIDRVIHQYTGEHAAYGRCSEDWKSSRERLENDSELRGQMMDRIREAAEQRSMEESVAGRV